MEREGWGEEGREGSGGGKREKYVYCTSNCSRGGRWKEDG